MSNFEDFSKLPKEVQRGFITQFKLVLDSAVDCGSFYNVFGDSMTKEQYETIYEIVRRFDDVKKEY